MARLDAYHQDLILADPDKSGFLLRCRRLCRWAFCVLPQPGEGQKYGKQSASFAGGI
jgi:hypothetical protein